jgi:hypothetical protein
VEVSSPDRGMKPNIGNGNGVGWVERGQGSRWWWVHPALVSIQWPKVDGLLFKSRERDLVVGYLEKGSHRPPCTSLRFSYEEVGVGG